MRLHIFLLATLLLAAATGAVAAQEDTIPLEERVDDGDQYECIEHIDPNTAICEVGIVDGHAELIIESDRRQRITLTEAMFRGDGELNRDSVLLEEGVNRVHFATDTSGDVAVTIDTGSVLYGKMIDTTDPLVGGPWSASDTQAAALGGASGVSFAVLLVVFRTLYSRESGIERLA